MILLAHASFSTAFSVWANKGEMPAILRTQLLFQAFVLRNDKEGLLKLLGSAIAQLGTKADENQPEMTSARA